MLSINIVEVIHLRLQISKITTVPPKKYIRTTSIFRVSNKVKKKNKKKTKNIEMTSIFFTSKFCKKSTSSVETTLIFLPWKLRQRKYVKTTSIFHPSKLYRKGTSKWRGNSEIFTFQYIDVFQSTLTCACWMVSHTISGHQKQLST